MADPTWLPVPDWDGFYEVSRHGEVRSLDRTLTLTNGQQRRYKGRPLKTHTGPGTRGYPQVALSRPGQDPVNVPVHILVLRAFVGEPGPGQEARHGPGGKDDASLLNLCYGTRAENVGPDRLRDGQDNRGENHGLHKLTASQVRDLRIRRGRGETWGHIASLHGISIGAARCAVTRKTWAWLE